MFGGLSPKKEGGKEVKMVTSEVRVASPSPVKKEQITRSPGRSPGREIKEVTRPFCS